MAAKKLSSLYAGNGYHRTRFTSKLVQLFLDGVEVVPHHKFPQLHQAKLKIKTFVFVEVLKNITFESVIRSPMLQVVEYRGKDVIKKIYEVISSANGERLMPPDFREIYRQGDSLGRTRTICDFIAGMTDRYAVEFYSRLIGANGMTMHKPL
jgi:dGTPase